MADIKELMQVRKDKMQKIKDHGISVRPERYDAHNKRRKKVSRWNKKCFNCGENNV